MAKRRVQSAFAKALTEIDPNQVAPRPLRPAAFSVISKLTFDYRKRAVKAHQIRLERIFKGNEAFGPSIPELS